MSLTNFGIQVLDEFHNQVNVKSYAVCFEQKDVDARPAILIQAFLRTDAERMLDRLRKLSVNGIIKDEKFEIVEGVVQLNPDEQDKLYKYMKNRFPNGAL